MRFLFILVILSLGAVAGCSQQTVSSPVSNGALGMRLTHAITPFKTIYKFKGPPDGTQPDASLTLSPTVPGSFYGTTRGGGEGKNAVGTAFVVTEKGSERVLHTFRSTEAAIPEAAPTFLKSNLFYGTTVSGGKALNGAVYEMRTDGTERVLFYFNGSNGSSPDASLTLFNDSFYSTADNGGADNKGVVFEVRPNGTQRVVYSFKGMPDGDSPQAELTLWDGAFYGTTYRGGTKDMGCVFEVKTDGTERVLYSFKGETDGDGALPLAGVTLLNGVLYGDTLRGGANDRGTIFEIRKDGSERVIYSFKAPRSSDGSLPRASLTVFNGKLYGTTSHGGADDAGTVFEISPDGTLRLLHEFSGPDGRNPKASLTVSGSVLAGTTSRGGQGENGTFFELKP